MFNIYRKVLSQLGLKWPKYADGESYMVLRANRSSIFNSFHERNCEIFKASFKLFNALWISFNLYNNIKYVAKVLYGLDSFKLSCQYVHAHLFIFPHWLTHICGRTLPDSIGSNWDRKGRSVSRTGRSVWSIWFLDSLVDSSWFESSRPDSSLLAA